MGCNVIDGSIIPRSLGVNPLFTISALSERAMMLMAEDNGLEFNDNPAEPAAPITVDAPGLVVSDNNSK